MIENHEAGQAVLRRLIAVDEARPRSRQKAVGLSEIGGCARKVQHTSRGDAPTNLGTRRLAAIVGTALHSVAEAAYADDSAVMVEGKVVVSGIRGSYDRYRYLPEEGTVEDIKTSRIDTVNFWRRRGSMGRQYRWQLHLLGKGLTIRGFAVDWVRLICIPRDGTDDDVTAFEEPYDPDVADEAIAWYRMLADKALHGEMVEPEKPRDTFCKPYCEFYDPSGERGCPGLDPKQAKGVQILDEETAAAAWEFMDAKETKQAAEARMLAAREVLVECAGGITLDDISIRWQVSKDGEAVDMDKIRKAYADQHVPLPMKHKHGNESLYVERVKL